MHARSYGRTGHIRVSTGVPSVARPCRQALWDPFAARVGHVIFILYGVRLRGAMMVTPFEIHGQEAACIHGRVDRLNSQCALGQAGKKLSLQPATQVEAPQLEFDPSRSRTSG